MAYLDILILSADIETRFEYLVQVLKLLKDADMTLRLEKRRLMPNEIEGAYKIS